MIKVDITANNVASSYRVPMILGESILGLKWDSGAKYTVISVKVLNSDLSGDGLERIKQYCEGHSNHREQFVSASIWDCLRILEGITPEEAKDRSSDKVSVL